MATLTKSVHIDAPVEKVFAYLEDPLKALDYWPSMVDVRNVKIKPDGCKTYDWTYKMGGMKFDGSSEDVEVVPNAKTVTVSKGGIDSTIIWMLTPDGGGTNVTFTVEYKVPVPILGKLAESIIIKQNERETETLLANLKTVMEVSERVENG